MVAGILGAFFTHFFSAAATSTSGSALAASFWGAIIAFVVDAVVTVVVSLVTQPKPDAELRGLVWGLNREDPEDDSLKGDDAWYRSPLAARRRRARPGRDPEHRLHLGGTT